MNDELMENLEVLNVCLSMTQCVLYGSFLYIRKESYEFGGSLLVLKPKFAFLKIFCNQLFTNSDFKSLYHSTISLQNNTIFLCATIINFE